MAFKFVALSALASLALAQNGTNFDCPLSYGTWYPGGLDYNDGTPDTPPIRASAVTVDKTATVFNLACATATPGANTPDCQDRVFPQHSLTMGATTMKEDMSAEGFTMTRDCEFPIVTDRPLAITCKESASGDLTDFTGERTHTYSTGGIVVCVTAGNEKIESAIGTPTATQIASLIFFASTDATSSTPSPTGPPEFTGAANVLAGQGVFVAGAGVLAGLLL